MTATVIQLDHRHAALANARQIVRSATASPVTVMMACDVLDMGNADDADLSRQLRYAMRPQLAAAVNEAARRDARAHDPMPSLQMMVIVVALAAVVFASGIGLAVQAWWLAMIVAGL